MKTILSTSEQATKDIAGAMAKNMKKTRFFCLYGDLGSGKTVFAKGFAKGLGIPEEKIKSPTYTLMRLYKTRTGLLYHFDFYRILETDDLLEQYLREIFSAKTGVMVIEWPDRISALLPPKRTDIYFEYKNPTTRLITIKDD